MFIKWLLKWYYIFNFAPYVYTCAIIYYNVSLNKKCWKHNTKVSKTWFLYPFKTTKSPI